MNTRTLLYLLNNYRGVLMTDPYIYEYSKTHGASKIKTFNASKCIKWDNDYV